MASASQSPSSDPPAERRLDSGQGPTESGPRLAYRAVLARYKRAKLADIRLAQGMQPGLAQVRPPRAPTRSPSISTGPRPRER